MPIDYDCTKCGNARPCARHGTPNITQYTYRGQAFSYSVVMVTPGRESSTVEITKHLTPKHILPIGAIVTVPNARLI